MQNVGGVSGTLPASEAMCMGQSGRQGVKGKSYMQVDVGQYII